MQKHETNELLTILSVAYPNHYKNISDEQKKQTLALYYTMFEPYPSELVSHALKNYIRVNQYPPTIAGLQEQIDLLQGTEQTPAQLWVLCEKAISNSAYAYVEEFNKLPECVQQWLGNPIALHKLGQQESEITQSVTRGQFLKSIEAIQKRQKAQKALPEPIKEQIKQLTQTNL